MAPQRKIKASHIVNDLKAGLTNGQLMEKYELSAKGLKSLLQKLVDARKIAQAEVELRIPEAEDLTIRTREEGRHYLFVPLPVYDLDNMAQEGLVLDINEKGLQTSGISCESGESKSLLIQADEFADVFPFTFDAVCRWVKSGDTPEEPAVGFEIVSISEVGLEELRKLIHFLSLGGLGD